jgi:superfamily II DNA or RNA helicase
MKVLKIVSNLFEKIRIIDAGPHEFRRSVQRLMLQNGFEAFSVDGPGDGGGDLFCEREGERWIIQSKWKKSNNVGHSAIKEILNARIQYDAHKALIVTNQHFSNKMIQQVNALRDDGIDIDLWSGDDLINFAKESPAEMDAKILRSYQEESVKCIQNDLDSRGKSLLFLATGMGKTVVAGSIIRNQFSQKPDSKILVLAHMNELIEQLQKALWEDVPLNIPTQLINSENSPDILNGLTVSTNLSIRKYINAGYQPDLLIVDECHHVGNDNKFRDIISLLPDVPLLGVTATPWRGDGFSIENVFGSPSYTCGIERGMKNGYLAPVDYRLFCDNIDWDSIPKLSSHAYSIKQLNKKLFLPQRDELLIDTLSEQWIESRNPKCIIFCQGVEHAKRIHEKLTKYERWKHAEIIHSKLNKMHRKMALLKFRTEECPILVSVDILNEGVDVPNVNIVCFSRVTHSRKIFVQQLGRGLRVAPGKENVLVLDFAADTRRLAAIYGLQCEINSTDPIEEIEFQRNIIEFSDQRVRTLMEEWVMDAADLETQNQESKLQFPNIEL